MGLGVLCGRALDRLTPGLQGPDFSQQQAPREGPGQLCRPRTQEGEGAGNPRHGWDSRPGMLGPRGQGWAGLGRASSGGRAQARRDYRQAPGAPCHRQMGNRGSAGQCKDKIRAHVPWVPGWHCVGTTGSGSGPQAPHLGPCCFPPQVSPWAPSLTPKLPGSPRVLRSSLRTSFVKCLLSTAVWLVYRSVWQALPQAG